MATDVDKNSCQRQIFLVSDTYMIKRSEDSLGKKLQIKNVPLLEFCIKVPSGSLEKVVLVVGADF